MHMYFTLSEFGFGSESAEISIHNMHTLRFHMCPHRISPTMHFLFLEFQWLTPTNEFLGEHSSNNVILCIRLLRSRYWFDTFNVRCIQLYSPFTVNWRKRIHVCKLNNIIVWGILGAQIDKENCASRYYMKQSNIKTTWFVTNYVQRRCE